jgi:hypothetical protein
MKVLSVDGKEVEIIEMIGEILIVQEIKTKIIYNIYHYDLDKLEIPEPNDKMDSNVISITGWEQWKKRKKQKSLRNFQRSLKRSV